MAQGPSDTILVAIRITLRIRGPKSEIRILRIGGGLCSLSASSLPYGALCIFPIGTQVRYPNSRN